MPINRFQHDRLLGTSLAVIVFGDLDDDAAERVDASVAAEVRRLEGIFSIFDPDSELQRWKRGEVDANSDEFVEVIGEAIEWQRRSDGAFNPLVAEVSALWRAAERSAKLPDVAELEATVASIAEPRVQVVDSTVVPIGDVSGLQLHAFAKGWIVDRALQAAFEAHPDLEFDLIVNAGGDLSHRGSEARTVGIENPLRVYDNEPPVDRITLHNAGLATSGRARQGFVIAGTRYSHVIDPRTGWPVDGSASISVIAPSAGDADVIATIAGVSAPRDAVEAATSFGVACLVVDNAGTLMANPAWEHLRPD